jgi:hypothetical protein
VPALPPVPNVIKWELLFTQAGVPGACIFHSAFTGGSPSGSDLQGFGNQGWAALDTAGFLTNYTADTVFVGFKLTDLTTASSAVGEYPIGLAGTYDGPASPAQACVLANYEIVRRYRGGHPRTYFPPPAAVYLLSPSEWTAGEVTAVGDYVTALFNVFNTASEGTTDLGGPVCVSYRTGNAPRVAPLVEPVTGFVVSPILATQRRRIRASSY